MHPYYHLGSVQLKKLGVGIFLLLIYSLYPCNLLFSSNDSNIDLASLSQGCGVNAKGMIGSSEVCTPATKVYSQAEIIAFGGIHDEAARGVRSSGRLRAQPNADATQMERAMMNAQRRNEVIGQGTNLPSISSLRSFSDEQIIDQVKTLGISLGCSHVDRLASVKLIKDIEMHRNLTLLAKNEIVTNLGDKNNLCLVVSRASNMCEDLNDDESEMGDESAVTPPGVLKPKRDRRKKSYDKTKVRRSNRIRIKKTKS
jgi:hypothetical protein